MNLNLSRFPFALVDNDRHGLIRRPSPYVWAVYLSGGNTNGLFSDCEIVCENGHLIGRAYGISGRRLWPEIAWASGQHPVLKGDGLRSCNCSKCGAPYFRLPKSY